MKWTEDVTIIIPQKGEYEKGLSEYLLLREYDPAAFI
jgi:hypothetical protein